jgi:hypothetical protein
MKFMMRSVTRQFKKQREGTTKIGYKSICIPGTGFIKTKKENK